MQASQITQTTFIAQVEHHTQLTSTNDRALGLVIGRAAAVGDTRLPLLVIADRQTAGRGRGTKRWWTGPEGLAFSVLLDAHRLGLEPYRQSPSIAVAAGGAVVDAIRRCLPAVADRVQPRWPNDVYADGRKLAGVLIEAPCPARLVIGVGLNVNARASQAPPEMAASIATLRDLCGHAVDRERLLVGILQALEDRLGRVKGPT